MHSIGARRVFAGQRADSFFVDLGSVFDLGTLRPFQHLHLIPSAAGAGVDSLRRSNVHTIALRVPIDELTRKKTRETNPMSSNAVIGVWGAASRQKATTRALPAVERRPVRAGLAPRQPVVQRGHRADGREDKWNSGGPAGDSDFAKYVAQPELAKLLPVLYPGVFPNLAGLSADRADLLAILLTGIPSGIVPGFQNFTGPKQADYLRLNVAIPPASSPNRLGLIGGDPAGFPNGRRLTDDVVTIELRAIAGATYPLVDPSYTPDGATSVIEDGTFGSPGRTFLPKFPFIGTPYSGYEA